MLQVAACSGCSICSTTQQAQHPEAGAALRSTTQQAQQWRKRVSVYLNADAIYPYKASRLETSKNKEQVF
ncbi:hypothetical protein [Mucilaginibacter koreensis]